MSKPFDYSKWDNIELSDDEEDVHPNIDRESWFRMKHRSRVEREEREEIDKKKIKDEMAKADLRIKEISKILQSIENNEDSDDELEDKDGLEAEKKELQKANKARQDKLDEYEKNKKWNVDNMCHVVEERTIINPGAGKTEFTEKGYAKPVDEDKKYKQEKSGDESNVSVTTTAVSKKSAEETNNDKDEENIKPKSSEAKQPTVPTSTQSLTNTTKRSSIPVIPAKPNVGPDREEIAMLSYHEFTVNYADVVEQFMAISSLDQSRDFLIQNGTILLQENASNYLLLASLEDEMNGFRDKMRLTARQSQIISNITELAKTMRTHPGNVIIPFFKRLEEKEHFDGFMSGLEQFIQNLIKRAVVKRREMDAERAKEEGVDLKDVPRHERLGPGGLDPVEVFESLPPSLQEAFESRDTEQLKAALLAMDPEDAEMHMKRCVDAGLWNEG
jgi:cell division cycle protein 37